VAISRSDGKTDSPPEAPSSEWRDWGPEARYAFCERLGMGADRLTALEEARARHAFDESKGRLFG